MTSLGPGPIPTFGIVLKTYKVSNRQVGLNLKKKITIGTSKKKI